MTIYVMGIGICDAKRTKVRGEYYQWTLCKDDIESVGEYSYDNQTAFINSLLKFKKDYGKKQQHPAPSVM